MADFTMGGVAIPVVSPKVTPLKPSALYCLEISTSFLYSTFPSKGHPKAVDISPCTGILLSLANLTTSSKPVKDSLIDLLRFF